MRIISRTKQKFERNEKIRQKKQEIHAKHVKWKTLEWRNQSHFSQKGLNSFPLLKHRKNEYLEKLYRKQTGFPQQTMLVTMDVASPYTNIPQEEGTQVVCKSYNKYYQNNPPEYLPSFWEKCCISFSKKIHSNLKKS